MGAIIYIVNFDKRQYIDPACFGEIAEPGGYMLGYHARAVALLTCAPGPLIDLGSQWPGAWFGDRVQVVYNPPEEPARGAAIASMWYTTPMNSTRSRSSLQSPRTRSHALCDGPAGIRRSQPRSSSHHLQLGRRSRGSHRAAPATKSDHRTRTTSCGTSGESSLTTGARGSSGLAENYGPDWRSTTSELKPPSILSENGMNSDVWRARPAPLMREWEKE